MSSKIVVIFVLILPCLVAANSQSVADAQSQSQSQSPSQSQPPRQWPIIIDPGHGGQDKGAQFAGQNESDLVLKIALMLKEKLQNTSVQSFLTRGSDQTVDLSERLMLAEKNKAELFVSLHANSNRFTSVKGAEFYFREQRLNPTPTNNSKNQNLGAKNTGLSIVEMSQATLNNILSDLTSTTQTLQSLKFSKTLKSNWQGSQSTIKTAPFYVLSNAKIPSILIEVGYMSSPEELTLLMSDNYKEQIVESIKNSILSYQKTRQLN